MTGTTGDTRRRLLQTASAGFGYVALAGLLARADESSEQAQPQAAQPLADRKSVV